LPSWIRIDPTEFGYDPAETHVGKQAKIDYFYASLTGRGIKKERCRSEPDPMWMDPIWSVAYPERISGYEP
jgi:hypothetical protein